MKYMMIIVLMLFCIKMGAAENGVINYTTKEQTPLLSEKIVKSAEKRVLYTLEEIQKRCPVTIGNKQFTVGDIAERTDEQKEWFFDRDSSATRYHLCCGETRKVFSAEDIAFLKKMPRKYTEGLEIQTPKYEQYCETAACWLGSIFFSAFCTSAIVACTCGQACCKATLVGKNAMYAMMGFGPGTIVTPICAMIGECCCNQHCTRTYKFDEEEEEVK